MFHFLVRMNSKKLLFTTTTEKVVDDVNRFVRIFLISTIMSVVWLTIQEVIQMTLNYQIHDMLIGAVCFVIVYRFYPALTGSKNPI
ncbi:hypothetical protein CN941_02275 [Bacillus cereus]|uniref:hypothetical protein n=1 Tax=Bacillus nitratireducens TaxID=2026193 RepID=UPI0002791652|nr:hypothetical protein [Bacillus nitratireducens]EJQ11768.1 hypothetical protein IE3_03229 [Bacillus cereus BAG3X2-1]PEA22997.1 hypothetical protein CON40_00950 [Bacillus cereus]PEU01448.1 hypothetical protein CN527_11350 [Bacillus cereus]PEV98197.1 hypothetical protein CN428_23515 [Bacillus cereus]PEZ93060.1 hypothetical protein CN374_03740 [Bacillus cereus]